LGREKGKKVFRLLAAHGIGGEQGQEQVEGVGPAPASGGVKMLQDLGLVLDRQAFHARLEFPFGGPAGLMDGLPTGGSGGMGAGGRGTLLPPALQPQVEEMIQEERGAGMGRNGLGKERQEGIGPSGGLSVEQAFLPPGQLQPGSAGKPDLAHTDPVRKEEGRDRGEPGLGPRSAREPGRDRPRRKLLQDRIGDGHRLVRSGEVHGEVKMAFAEGVPLVHAGQSQFMAPKQERLAHGQGEGSAGQAFRRAREVYEATAQEDLADPCRGHGRGAADHGGPLLRAGTG